MLFALMMWMVLQDSSFSHLTYIWTSQGRWPE
jgi:hypothetical protein